MPNIFEQVKSLRDTLTSNLGTRQFQPVLDPRNLLDRVKPFVEALSGQTRNKQTASAVKPTPEPVTPKQNPLPPVRTRADHIAGFNLRGYSTREEHISEVREIYSGTPRLRTSEDIQQEIIRVMKVKNQANPSESPVTGEMVLDASQRWQVPPRLLVALMRKETGLGIEGKGIEFKNPGNIGITDEGGIIEYPTWQEGVNAVAKELSRRRISGFLK